MARSDLFVALIPLIAVACTPNLKVDLTCSDGADCQPGFQCVSQICVPPCPENQVVSQWQPIVSPIPELQDLVRDAKLFLCPTGFAITGIHTERHVPETDTILTFQCTRVVDAEQ